MDKLLVRHSPLSLSSCLRRCHPARLSLPPEKGNKIAQSSRPAPLPSFAAPPPTSGSSAPRSDPRRRAPPHPPRRPGPVSSASPTPGSGSSAQRPRSSVRASPVLERRPRSLPSARAPSAPSATAPLSAVVERRPRPPRERRPRASYAPSATALSWSDVRASATAPSAKRQEATARAFFYPSQVASFHYQLRNRLWTTSLSCRLRNRLWTTSPSCTQRHSLLHRPLELVNVLPLLPSPFLCLCIFVRKNLCFVTWFSCRRGCSSLKLVLTCYY
ncbi:anther-specific proline-rich protein APG-like isoform X2 [Sorghum bicolor]|uniref:anther-specific proline-rich protein APG-like isoform X2 n=1 Tax=Sorghum bicolor TaxID=4558 RepID=UPI000B426321|nr:anther-specific proline-rich protein APG-like isoform X2 [Sorghum bicolor]|eukprot:XP_021306894.1 anther-specific proline-rich protein APG-like isoform X2 [Sorghum bicolor]